MTAVIVNWLATRSWRRPPPATASTTGRRRPSRRPPGTANTSACWAAPSPPEGGAEDHEVEEEDHDPDDQQVQQALHDHADDPERDRSENDEQEQCHHASSAPGEPAGAGAFVRHAVVLEDLRLLFSKQLPIGVDARRVPDQLLRKGHP